jgi:hypothetical protein
MVRHTIEKVFMASQVQLGILRKGKVRLEFWE